MQRIVGQVRKAVEDYGMIEDGDRIAVGISGGKDSLILASALAKLSKYYPKKFEVVGLTIDMGYKADYSGVVNFCKAHGIEYRVKYTQIKEIVFDYRKESNPCSLCAKLRRGALNDFAKENGCNKLALGHHNDDVLETFFLSLMYEGRLHTFSPVTHFERSGICMIRPLIYVREYEVKSAVKRYSVPVVKSPCPVDGLTKRAEMKEIIDGLDKKTGKGLRKRLFNAVKGLEDWKIEK